MTRTRSATETKLSTAVAGRVTRRWAAAVGLVCWSLVMATPSTAEPSIQFVDDSVLTFTVTEDGIDPDSHIVSVVVSGSSPDAAVRMETTAEAARWTTIKPRGSAVSNPARLDFLIEVAARVTAPVEAQVVATTTDGAIARRPLAIVPEPPQKIPLPKKLTFLGTTDAPLNPGTEVKPQSDPSFESGTREVVGKVSSAGAVGTVTLKGDTLSVIGLTDAGTYEGHVDLTAAEGDEIDVTVHVRDAILWPLAVLLAGLWLTTRMDVFRTIGAPGRGLKIRLRRMKEDIERDRHDAEERLRVHLPSGRLPRAATLRHASSQLLFDILEVRALSSWVTALDQTERDAWKPGGDEFKKLVELRTSYGAALENILACADLVHTITDDAKALGAKAAAAKSPIVQQLARLSDTSDIEDARALAQLVNDAARAAESLTHLRSHLARAAAALSGASEKRTQKLRTYAKELLAMRPDVAVDAWPKFPDNGDAQSTDKALHQLPAMREFMRGPRTYEPSRYEPTLLHYDVPFGSAERYLVDAVSTYTVEMGGTEYLVAAGDQTSATALDHSKARPVTLTQARGDQTPVILITETASVDPQLELIEATGTGPLGESGDTPGVDTTALLTDYKKREAMYSAAAAVVTILAGLGAFYFPEPAFGSPTHYLEAFLWGGVGGKGADVVAKLLASR